MTQKSRRGRPRGGKHLEPIRDYWRNLQRDYRARNISATVTGKRRKKQ